MNTDTNWTRKDLHILSLLTDGHSILCQNRRQRHQGISRQWLSLQQANCPETAGMSGGPAWTTGWEEEPEAILDF